MLRLRTIDILEEIGLTGVRGGAEALCTSEARATPDFLLRHMEAGESYDLDALSAVFGLKNGELMSKLVDLELGGLLSRSELGRYRRLTG